MSSYGGYRDIKCHSLTSSICPPPKKKKVCVLNETTMEFWEGSEVKKPAYHWQNKFKKQATYSVGDHTVFKQEYWDNPTRKSPKIK